MKKANIKKFLLSTAAVLLVVGLSMAGTFAYLQSESETKINTFNANKVMVSLEETTDSNFDIIPGSEQKKDPKVTVDNSIDAYVYVQITDTTEGLVTYALADGWTQLKGTTDVYWRAVGKDGEKNFSVLKDDKVSYAASLTNEDMERVKDEGKEPKLTFKAFAIQQQPFANEVEAWTQIPIQVATEEELQNALDSAVPGKPIKLAAPVSASEPLVVTKPGTVLDLNGQTIAPAEGTTIWDNANNWSLLSVSGPEAELTINGNGNFVATPDDSYAVDVRDGGKLTINGGEYVGNVHAVYVEKGELTVNGGKFSVQQQYPDASKAYEFTLNCYDANYQNGTAKILVTGGSFYEFNPTNCAAEGANTNFAPYGYTAEKDEEDYYNVKAYTFHKITDLNDSIKNVQDGGTVILNENVEGSNATIYIKFQSTEPKKITLDLNGHKFARARNDSDLVRITAAPGSEIIIRDGELETAVGYGISVSEGVKVTLENVKLTTKDYALVAAGDDEIVLKNCEITASDPESWAVMCYESSNNVTIEDTVINADTALYQNGSAAPSTFNLRNTTINGGTVAVYISNSLANNAYQTLNIENCTIKGGTAVEVKHTNATITNSTLTATATEKKAWVESSGSCTSGYALAVTSNGADEAATGTVTVTGGSVGDVFVFDDEASVQVDGKEAPRSYEYPDPTPAE